MESKATATIANAATKVTIATKATIATTAATATITTTATTTQLLLLQRQRIEKSRYALIRLKFVNIHLLLDHRVYQDQAVFPLGLLVGKENAKNYCP
jgi:hypothetical protein